MVNIENLVRSNIRALKPYSSARQEYDGSAGIFLDANESPYGVLNRYPDPLQLLVRNKLSQLKGVSIDQLCLGNGSDEVIDLIIRIFCEPQMDKVIICPPTYGMYEVCAGINNVEVIYSPLLKDFQPDVESILSNKAKVLFLCSPNNPTGNCLNRIEEILLKFEGIVFIDEAYIDFCKDRSLLCLIEKYPNLIISQTFSKAWGHAGLRVGVAYADKKIIDLILKVKPPYNINELSQQHLLNSLNDIENYERNIQSVLIEKQRLFIELNKVDGIENVYPSDANFLLIRVKDADDLYNYLLRRGIVVRNRNSIISNCVRITIGSPNENTELIDALKIYKG